MTAEIVILNWNGRDHLRTFLPSVVAAAPAGVGVTVADNGSTDDSAEVLAREFPTVRVVRLGRNYGFAEGYNRALREVDAECFVLLNSDVETPAGWLEPLLEVLEREPDVAAVAPKLRSWRDRASFEYAGAAGGYLDLLGYPFCRGRILRCVERDEGQYDDERDVFWVSGAAFCCRAEVFRELGGFDASFFAHMEEIDLCWRMRIAGRRVRIVPRSAVYHLGGGTQSLLQPPEQPRHAVQVRTRAAAAAYGRGAAAARCARSPLLPGAGALAELLRRGPRVVVVPAASSRTRPGPAPDSGDTPGIRRHLYLSGFDRAALPRGAPDLRADDVRLRRAAGRLRRTRVQLRFDGRTAYFPCLFFAFQN